MRQANPGAGPARARRCAGLRAAVQARGADCQEKPWRSFFGSICGKLARAFGDIAPGPGSGFVLHSKTACTPVRVRAARAARPTPRGLS